MADTRAPCLLVAGLSVRAMAEAARRDGLQVIALDLFGDADTRAASQAWWPIGEAGGALRIDGARFLAAVGAACAAARQRGQALIGLWPGSGFEGRPDWLAQAELALPLCGTPVAAMRAVNDPRRFFSTLAAAALPHPPVRWRRPAATQGWLLKQAGGQGGAGVRHAGVDDADPPPPDRYWQARLDGPVLSMTLLAAGGGRAAVLGLNRSWCLPQPGRPFAFGGVLSPAQGHGLDAAAAQHLAERLVAAFDLRGLVGVDLVWHAGQPWLLEVNARWPASAALYAPGGGLARAHLAASLHGELPDAATLAAWRPATPTGWQLVLAPGPMHLGAAELARWAALGHVHDRPAQPGPVPGGAPLCSVSARAPDEAALRAGLDARSAALCPQAWPA